MTTKSRTSSPDTTRTSRCSGHVETMNRESAGQASLASVYAPEASAVYPGSAEVSLRPERSGAAAAERSTLRRPRTGREQLASLGRTLSARDFQILDSLSLHPFLTTGQLVRLHFADHMTEVSGGRVCRRVLMRLAELRVVEHLERRIGGVRAGSASFVWRLGPVGHRLLSLAASGADSARARRKQPSLHHLEHNLAIADAHLRLLEASATHRFDLLRVQTEPRSWRPYVGAAGERLVLKPDLYAVTASGDYEDHWFVEVDRGTESLPTLLRKCGLYEAYRRSGAEQRSNDVFPWVLWLMPSAALASKLRAAVDASRTLDHALYRITTFDRLVAVIEGEPS